MSSLGCDDPCSCGSGTEFKNCCIRKQSTANTRQYQLSQDATTRDVSVQMQQIFAQASDLYQKGQLSLSQALYEQILQIQPNHFDVLHLMGVIAYQTMNPERAVELISKAIAINPQIAAAYNNRGIALRAIKKLQAAVESYDKAIALKPDYADAYCNRGNALQDLKQYDAALENYDKAIILKPDYAVAYNNCGNALRDIKQYQAAIESYDKAFALNPDYEFLCGLRLYSKMHICDWGDVENQIKQLGAKIERGEKASIPFPVLALTSSLALQRKAAEIYVQDHYPANHSLPEIRKRPRHDRIRVGYFSADFRNHPVSLLTVGLFETHDRSKFELTAFSFGPDTGDDVRNRVMAAFDRFIDVRERSDQEVATLARSLEIDIAVDLGGFTQDSRAGIFAMRAAPIQVGYIGYLGTMGAGYMDYFVADRTLVPEASRRHYAEKIVYLPSYQANDSKRVISDRRFTREELGLPETGFVFCCFNNNYKITPGTFDGWMRVLGRVEGSVLFLYADNEQAEINLKKEAVARGVDADRLVFGKRLPLPEYLARYRAADLFLDTFPYNAGTTASDALWAGLPVLTRTGEAFASRVAASLLDAIRLPELVTSTQEEYEALAVALATCPERLKAIEEKLARNRPTAPLFDTRLFARHIEAAYSAMVERYQNDLPPEHISVSRF